MVNPRIGLHLGHRQELRLLQSPQMIQAMQILQQPLLELKDRIDAELQENVFLEVQEAPPAEEGQAENYEPPPPPEPPPSQPAVDLGEPVAALFETLEDLERRSGDYRPGRARTDTDGEDPKQEALQNTAVSGVTLFEHLMAQVAFLDLAPALRGLVEQTIYNLDENGRLLATPAEIAVEAGPGVTEEQALEALAVVQTLDPPGVGAADLKECLLLQLDRMEGDHSAVRRLIEEHLEDIQKNRLPRICKKTGMSMDELKQALLFLRHLTPRPGAEFGREVNQSIVPDIVVREEGDRFEVRVERETLPSLQISPMYKQLLKEARRDPQVLEYLRKKIEAARAFIDAVAQRQSTLGRIAQELVQRQEAFLEQGIERLRPMRMQDIADSLGLHISTVSRAISGKYMETPQGILPLKRFFSAGTTSNEGRELSQQTIKEWVREIVESEDRSQPISDDEIVERLARERNVQLARRTVTKYRKALGIPSSRQRKSY